MTRPSMQHEAFEIGFDHYRLMVPFEVSRFPIDFRKYLQQGYDAAKQQCVTRKKPDIFDRKWLTIRDRALVKGIDVTITANDLMQALMVAGDICPITLLPFTFGESVGTDWSVDRVDNSRGYHADNIVIISDDANQRKGDMDIVDIIKNAVFLSASETSEEFNCWIRMARFYYNRLSFERPLRMCKLLSKEDMLYDHILYFQLTSDNSKVARQFVKILAKYIKKDDLNKTIKLSNKRYFHRHDSDRNAIYGSPKLCASLQNIKKVVNAHSDDFDKVMMDFMFS